MLNRANAFPVAPAPNIFVVAKPSGRRTSRVRSGSPDLVPYKAKVRVRVRSDRFKSVVTARICEDLSLGSRIRFLNKLDRIIKRSFSLDQLPCLVGDARRWMPRNLSAAELEAINRRFYCGIGRNSLPGRQISVTSRAVNTARTGGGPSRTPFSTVDKLF